MLPTLLVLLSASVSLQDPPQIERETDRPSVRAQALRQRIHGMRSDLLLGGDGVRQAEAEAADFYRQKIESIDQTLDALRAEQSEKRAGYDLALRHALEATEQPTRVSAMKEAADLRAKTTSLEDELMNLERRRESVASLLAAVESRDRERKKLATRLDSTSDPSMLLGLPFPSVGLAPPEGTDDDARYVAEGLVEDLMRVDPRRARQVLFEVDPDRYWIRFPLRPPADALREALAFPEPDLPGRR